MKILKIKERHVKRGRFVNGLRPTGWLVKVDDLSSPWRRLYERWDKTKRSTSKLVVGAPVPCVKIGDELIDLTAKQIEQVRSS